MKKDNPKNTLFRRLGLLVVVLAALCSCTYDYFVDESNLKVYVPQIVEGSIDNVLVSVHDASGAHVSSVYSEAPFENTYVRSGYVRFKIPVARGYRVSCFANIDPDSRTVGQPFDESYLFEPFYDEASNLFTSGPDFRVILFDSVTAYPYGYPEGSVLLADLDETTSRKGGVICSFTGLPDWVDRIDVRYLVGTHMYFDGIYRRPTSGWLAASHDVNAVDGVYETDIVGVFPSAGTHYSDSTLHEASREPVDVAVYYYDANGALQATTLPISMGSDIPAYDASGNPWDRLLDPLMIVRFEFRGFELIGVSLQGWDDIVEGGTTIY